MVCRAVGTIVFPFPLLPGFLSTVEKRTCHPDSDNETKHQAQRIVGAHASDPRPLLHGFPAQEQTLLKQPGHRAAT
jgi:hypothetical protein